LQGRLSRADVPAFLFRFFFSPDSLRLAARRVAPARLERISESAQRALNTSPHSPVRTADCPPATSVGICRALQRVFRLRCLQIAVQGEYYVGCLAALRKFSF
jgi:hypothetical protein